MAVTKIVSSNGTNRFLARCHHIKPNRYNIATTPGQNPLKSVKSTIEMCTYIITQTLFRIPHNLFTIQK